jgi:hypothetical protein
MTVNHCSEVFVDKGWMWVSTQLLNGVRSRVAMLLDGRERADGVKAFFEHARGSEDELSIIDLNSSTYEPLLEVLSFNRERPLRVLDIGCGNFTFHRFLKSCKAVIENYTGYDLIFHQSQLTHAARENISVVESDFVNSPTVRNVGANLAVAINSLSYIADLEGFCAKVVAQTTSDARLILVEPIPSLLWEPYFNGVRLNLRTPKCLQDEFQKRGWQLTHCRTLFVAKVLGQNVLALSQLQVYEKWQGSI